MEKRCEKCGRVAAAKPRERRCKHRRFGAGSYCCWGRLVPVAARRKAGPPAPTAGPDYEAVMAIRAAGRIATLTARLETAGREVVRVLESLDKWRKVQHRFARLAARTAEERQAESERARKAATAARERRRRRGLQLD